MLKVNKRIYKAMVVEEIEGGTFIRRIVERPIEALPEGEVLIKVSYSSLNYKDALSATGNKGITRKYPHTPGIDAAGIVEESVSDAFLPGDEVIVTGYDLGMNTSGGFGEYIRVPADWVVKRPDGLSLKECMIYGTAGFTAGQSVYRLQGCGITPDRGEVLVTGATGGVGSLSCAILAKAGYDVVAATGKIEKKQFLLDLGVKKIVHRDEVTDLAGRALLSERWAGAIDTVGGEMLATAIKSVKYRGAVTCCGLVASTELHTTIYPFILRGVTLMGIDSAKCPMEMRLKIWEKLGDDWKVDCLDTIKHECSLDELDYEIELILDGKQRGRAVVDLSK